MKRMVPSSQKADDELIYCYKIDGDTYTIPNSVKEIGTYAFSTQNNLKNVILSDNITELDDYEVFHIDADYILKIESIHLGKNFNDPTKKFEAFFEITTLKEITVSNENPNYTSIDGVLYDKDVTELAFFPNAKKSYTIPDSVTSTGNYSNYSHSLHNLKNLTISDTITDATDLFNLCYYVETIHIGKKVNKLNGNSTNTFPKYIYTQFLP